MTRVLRMTEEQYAAKIKSGGVEGHPVRWPNGNSGAARGQMRSGTQRHFPVAGIKPGPLTKQGRPFPASGVLPPKPSKYRSRKTGAYSSIKEAERAAELKMLEKAGQIRNLREQVSYELIPRQCIGGKLVERECRFIIDFVYDELQAGLWVPVCEDVKSEATKTPQYILKRKMALYFLGIRVRET